MSRHKPELSREKIAATAIAIADAEGFEAVTMRRLASEIGVGTMSLYHYVKTKEELVAMMDDALMADVILSSLPTDWRRALCEIATRTHKVLVSHSWVFSSILSASPGLNAMRHMEQCLQALDGTPLTDQQKLTLLAMVDDFVFGSALRDVLSAAHVDHAFAKKQLGSGNFPRLSAMFAGGNARPSKDRFEQGLHALLHAAGRKK
jgi:AcrR family transcriptional regulator